MKTYGAIHVDRETGKIVIDHCEPHVSIKLKKIFTKLSVSATHPYTFSNTPENGADLLWFMERYPMKVSKDDLAYLKRTERVYHHLINEVEALHSPKYKPRPVTLNEGEAARHYQLVAADIEYAVERMLLADDIGLGKTLSAILLLLKPLTLPGVVVCQTHMPRQWAGQIKRFTNLSVHVIMVTKPYTLPPADVYIMKYSCLSGWINTFEVNRWKTSIFDEIQELRCTGSAKHIAGRNLSANTERCVALSATPVYNYGDEIFNILDLIKPGCLGSRAEFIREWCTEHGNHFKVTDPQALGAYLKTSSLMLRRTRKEVGRELPPINKIVIPIDYDETEVKKSEDLVKVLAQKVITGTFFGRGEAARELDIMVRKTTGVAKARAVAAYVKMLLDTGERVILAGWHRAVYDIWLEELQEYKPVMYTGSETGKQKDDAFDTFNSYKTNIFIISLRSGAGLDGLQATCDLIVLGELDWSPEVQNQLIGRINRDRDGEQKQVTAIFPVTDWGSDPLMINLLGLKASQSYGIINPDSTPDEQFTDESRLKILAHQFLTT